MPDKPPSQDKFPTSRTVADFEHNLGFVRARISAACKRVGRDPESVRLLPVSKTVGQDRLRLAYTAGCHFLGENKVQEAYAKSQTMADLPDLRWSVIGHLQTNKAKLVARFADEFQALDSLRVARELDKRLQTEGRSLDVFVQVNSSGEASKYGLPPDEVLPFVRELPAFETLRVRGLMTLAVHSPDTAKVRGCFAVMRELRQHLRQDTSVGAETNDLSMGMSGDYETAIEEGATVIRVGQAIFGARALPDSHYWPAP